jgi:hypothetical protein
MTSIFWRQSPLGWILPILSWTDQRLTVSCLYSRYLSLHSGQFFNVGSFKPSFQQCLKKAHPPMCALLLARVLLLVSLVCFFFGSASLLLVAPLLVALFLHLSLPLVEEDARCHPGLGSG